MSIAVGSRVGPYEIVAHIGSGGMGDVWRARDTRLGREVAIKFLPQSVVANADRLQRFEQEARAAGALNHPNLVTIHEFGSHEGAPFIAMEFLDGETLRERIGDGAPRIPIRKAVEYGRQIAIGLSAAHDKGIVHRDLKPENIVVTKDDRIKILDFGIAKLMGPAETDMTDARTAAKGTAPGTVLGTVGYMSPEQVRGQDVDQRTDIFSFGAILYEMLSGKRPFRGDSAADTMSAILTEDPEEFGSTQQKVPPAIDRIIRRCLEKSRDQRFHAADDVAFALEAFGTPTSTTHEATNIDGSSRAPLTVAIVAAVGVALILAAMLGWRFFAPSGPKNPDLAFAQLTFDTGVENQPAISPDGRTFVFVREADGFRHIFLQRTDGRSAINLTKDSTANDYWPQFSPDGNLITFSSERDGGGLFIMGATGESVRRLADEGENPAWSPDGKEIAFSSERIESARSRQSNAALSVINIETGKVRKLDGMVDAVQPAWSPHGDRIAYWQAVGAGQRDIATISADGNKSSIVLATNDAAIDWNPVWSPDGQWLYFLSDRDGTQNLWRIAIDEKSGKTNGEPQPVRAAAESLESFSIARDGHQIIYAHGSKVNALRRIAVDIPRNSLKVEEKPLFEGTLLVRTTAISPDGQWIAFTTDGRQEDVFVMKRDGSGLRQLTDDAARDRGVRWLNDNNTIFFYSSRGKTYDIYSIRRDGSGMTSVTSGATAHYPRPSADGKRLAYMRLDESFVTDFKNGVAANVRTLPRLANGKVFNPNAWSPDGTRLLGEEWGARQKLYVLTLATGTYQQVADTGNVGGWEDDESILWIASDGQVHYNNMRTGVDRVIGRIGRPNESAAIAPGEILLADATVESDIWQMKIK